ncbi:hypothetical protein EVAR_25005_1 [Eumeta japonica]|uniref:Uncharacterized protein n=1 Tax=Eumeta variegata TaxID=151549 RepID=A0A4C1XKT9_EUMVA|nr:hypothetical protein EVAR_25005_1 [Eumeta japonica]
MFTAASNKRWNTGFHGLRDKKAYDSPETSNPPRRKSDCVRPVEDDRSRLLSGDRRCLARGARIGDAGVELRPINHIHVEGTR